MTQLPASCLLFAFSISDIPAWGWVDIFFTLLVLAGVCGESSKISTFFAKRFVKKHLLGFDMLVHDKGEKFKHWGEKLVIFGIAGELICLAFSLSDAAIMNREAQQLKASNLQLQIDLQKIKQGRMITPKQLNDFIFLTARMPKFYIRVGMGPSRDEVSSFSKDIVEMLERADFKIPDEDKKAFPFGIHQDPYAMIFRQDITNEYDTKKIVADVQFFVDFTNNLPTQGFNGEKTNGFIRPIINDGYSISNVAGLFAIFNEIGISAIWEYKPAWTGTNHLEIFVMQKP